MYGDEYKNIIFDTTLTFPNLRIYLNTIATYVNDKLELMDVMKVSKVKKPIIAVPIVTDYATYVPPPDFMDIKIGYIKYLDKLLRNLIKENNLSELQKFCDNSADKETIGNMLNEYNNIQQRIVFKNKKMSEIITHIYKCKNIDEIYYNDLIRQHHLYSYKLDENMTIGELTDYIINRKKNDEIRAEFKKHVDAKIECKIYNYKECISDLVNSKCKWEGDVDNINSKCMDI